MEIYAGSASYLISAGGSPADYALDPHIAGITFGKVGQQLGVAVTTSFIPTTSPGRRMQNDARSLIQFSQFAEGGPNHGPRNYGVAPDFACGHNLYLPPWALLPANPDGFAFLDLIRWGELGDVDPNDQLRPLTTRAHGPGFYLAIFRSGNLSVLEAYDTWLRPGLHFDVFCSDVQTLNPGLSLRENEEFIYTTCSGNRVYAVIWSQKHSPSRKSRFGAEVRKVDYGLTGTVQAQHAFAWDAIGDAGNVTDRFLNGTVLNSPAEAKVVITNPALGKTITLDMSQPLRPRRISESGVVEEAGNNNEVWLDFDWNGPSAGDVCQPFKDLGAASDAVAPGGVIRVIPGTTLGRHAIGAGKRFTLVAPIGGVVIGARSLADRAPITGSGEVAENVRKDDVWVEFDFPDSNKNNAPGKLPLKSLADAVGAVSDGGVIRIVPGRTGERSTLGGNKRFTLSAPIGQVTIGAR